MLDYILEIKVRTVQLWSVVHKNLVIVVNSRTVVSIGSFSLIKSFTDNYKEVGIKK